MNRSAIHVSYRDGSKPKGTRVVLGLPGGMSKPAYTDQYGTAIVEHESVGWADVYVSGNKRGRFHAPGEYPVFLS